MGVREVRAEKVNNQRECHGKGFWRHRRIWVGERREKEFQEEGSLEQRYKGENKLAKCRKSEV